jgi:hypothetical protein
MVSPTQESTGPGGDVVEEACALKCARVSAVDPPSSPWTPLLDIAAKLKPLNIYVGEVVVTGVVKGTAFDTQGNGTIDPNAVAARFYELAKQRTDLTVTFS